MKKFFFFLVLFLSTQVLADFSQNDSLIDLNMTFGEYENFKERVGRAVTNLPEFKAAQGNLKAAYANVKSSKSNLLPQINFMIDSSNALDRNYVLDQTNIVERSRSDHKTNMRLSVSQLLFDFGASKYDLSKNEALAKAARADLSITILDLTMQAIRSSIDLAFYYNLEQLVAESLTRHTSIRERIEQKVESGLSASRELSRAQAREAEAFAKLILVKENLNETSTKFRIFFPEGALPTKFPFHPVNLIERDINTSNQIMMKKNPHILKMDEFLNASIYKSKKANSFALPRLGIEVKGQQYDVTERSDEYDVFAGVNLTYDIYSGGKKVALKEKAIAEMQASKSNKDALLQTLLAKLKESTRNLRLSPSKLEAFMNAYEANQRSQYYATEQFQTSNVLLLELLQTERDYLDSSERMLETMRSIEIEKFSYLQITGELGDVFEVILE